MYAHFRALNLIPNKLHSVRLVTRLKAERATWKCSGELFLFLYLVYISPPAQFHWTTESDYSMDDDDDGVQEWSNPAGGPILFPKQFRRQLNKRNNFKTTNRWAIVQCGARLRCGWCVRSAWYGGLNGLETVFWLRISALLANCFSFVKQKAMRGRLLMRGLL